MKLQTNPTDRKQMVKDISELLGTASRYMGIPTYAFEVGCVIVNRDGTTDCNDPEVLERLIPMLNENGYLAEVPAIECDPDTEPESCQEPTDAAAPEIQEHGEMVTETTLTIPIIGMEPGDLRNLIFTLYSKQHLLNKAMGGGFLFIHENVINRLQEIDLETNAQLIELLDDFRGLDELRGIRIDDTHFSMTVPFSGEHPDDMMLYAILLSKVFENCRATKRVRPILQALGDNEKYLMHSWLIRLGCGGPDFKALRKRMTDGLTGFCAFPDQARAEKHKAKYAEIRRIRRETNEEATSHDE